MTHPFYPSGNPRFNHVAMSLPADLLDATNRADVCRFFDEVLGFTEMEVMTEDRRRLIMQASYDADHFLIAKRNDNAAAQRRRMRGVNAIREVRIQRHRHNDIAEGGHLRRGYQD